MFRVEQGGLGKGWLTKKRPTQSYVASVITSDGTREALNIIMFISIIIIVIITMLITCILLLLLITASNTSCIAVLLLLLLCISLSL